MIRMKVKKLISELKKLDGTLEVGVSMGDNAEGEIAGWVCNVGEEDEISFDTDEPTGQRAVVLRC